MPIEEEVSQAQQPKPQTEWATQDCITDFWAFELTA